MSSALIALLVLSLVTSVVGGVASYASQKSANEFNQSQYEDWKSYNTPANQMQRLGEAGLNPYMVNGVNNTLSQPFSVGQNTGLSELFSNMSSSLRSSAGSLLGSERNEIANTNAQTKITEADIHNRLANLRERMVILSEKRNDPMMALLWGQADAQTIGNMVLKNSAPDIIALRHYQAATAGENLDFLKQMHPLQLDWYEPFQRARVNQMLSSAMLHNAQRSHLSWSENFALQQALQNYSLKKQAAENDWLKFELGLEEKRNQFNRRLNLSEDYYDLAFKKFMWNIFTDVPSFFKK